MANPFLEELAAKDAAYAERTFDPELDNRYASMQDFMAVNPYASQGYQQQAAGEILRREAAALAPRTAGQILSDTGSALSQALVNAVAGTAAGLGVAVTADPAEMREKQLIAKANQHTSTANPYQRREYLSPDASPEEIEAYKAAKAQEEALATSVPTEEMIAEQQEPQQHQIIRDLNQRALEGVKWVTDTNEAIGDMLDSDQKQAQQERYDAAKTIYQQSDEYKNASDAAKVAMDIQFTASALAENPLLIEQIGVEGLVDIGTGLLSGGAAAALSKGAAKKAGKEATEKALAKTAGKELSESQSTVVAKEAAKKGAKAEAEVTQSAAAMAATVDTIVQEGGSNATQVAGEIQNMTHDQLMESEEYREVYERTGSEEDAKDIIASRAARNTFTGAGLSAAAIGKLTGATSATADLATGVGKRAASRVGDVAKETVEEGVQSGTGQVISNVAQQDVGIAKGTLEGVGETIVQGAVGGATGGGLPHAAATVTTGAGKTVSAAKSVAGTAATAYQAKQAERQEAQATEAPETPTEAPIQEAVQTAQETAEEAETVLQTDSEDTQAVKQATSNVNEYLTGLQERVRTGEVDDAASLFAEVTKLDEGYKQIKQRAETALQDESLSDQEREYLERVSQPAEGTVTRILADTAQANPAIRQMIDTTFTAITTGDTAEFEANIAGLEAAPIADEIKGQVKDILLGSVLYSGDVLNNPDITKEQLESAAQQTTGAVQQQYQAYAQLKDIDQVASDVINGQEDFIGVETHLQNIQQGLTEGEDITQSYNQLNNFLVNRQDKAAAIESGLEQAKTATGRQSIKVTYGNQGSFTIHTSDKGIAAAERVLSQVQQEETLVANALSAADTLMGGTTDGSTDSTITDGTTDTSDVSPSDTISDASTQTTGEVDATVSPTDTSDSVTDVADDQSVSDSTQRLQQSVQSLSDKGRPTAAEKQSMESDLRATIVKDDASPEAQIFDKTLATLGQDYIIKVDPKADAEGGGAMANWVTRTLTISPNMLNSDIAPLVIYHELDHMVQGKQLQKEQEANSALWQDLNAIHQTIAAATPSTDDYVASRINYFVNNQDPYHAINEMITVAKTDSDAVKDYLRSVQVPQTQLSAWDSIIQAAMRLFGIEPTPETISAYEAILAATDDKEAIVAGSTTPEADEFIETVAENRELKNREPAPINEEERQDAVDRAVSNTEALITDEKQVLTVRQNALQRELDRNPTLSEESPLYQEVRASEARIKQLQDQAVQIRDRAAQQYELEQVEWDLGVDETKAETPSGQLKSLAKNMLGALTGKRAIAAVNGEYADYELDVSSPKSITKFVRDKSTAFLESVVDFVANTPLTKADTAAVKKLIGDSKAITTASATLKNTLGSLKSAYEGTFDLGLDNNNRFKEGVIAYRDTKLWEDTDYLQALGNISPEATTEAVLETVKTLGLKATEKDVPMLKAMASKRNWFNTKFGELANNLNTLLDTKQQAQFDSQKLRFLLDENGQFPQKIIDTAFMAYTHGTDLATESFYNDNRQMMSMLGVNDESQLADFEADIRELRTLGAGITHKAMAREFKQALGLNHTQDMPESVTDSVYSAMGGVLYNVMQNDPELIHTRHQSADFGTLDGFTLRTDKSVEAFNKRTKQNTRKLGKPNFLQLKNDRRGFFNQITEGTDPTPKNWVGVKPPKVTANETHIRSRDTLTDDQIQAENIYREVKHVVDSTVGSLHRALGKEGYRFLKGYDADTDSYNAEHRKTVEGVNQEIDATYDAATEFLDTVDASDNKDIYFSNAFSGVRRQQQRGAVTPQGNKYHRILVGHKNGATIKSLDLTKLDGIKKNSNAYGLMLALGQAYGIDVDKQANPISVYGGIGKGGKPVKGMIAELKDIVEQHNSGEGVYAMLTSQMDADGNFTGIDVKTLAALKKETGGSDHHLQGVITVARLLNQAKDGKVTNFKHNIRAEIDGLTNGPAHSTVQNGLAGISEDQIEDVLARGGYLVGDGSGRNTHAQIGDGTITDFYLTVAANANESVGSLIEVLRDLVTDKSAKPNKRKQAQIQLDNYKFLGDKRIAIQGEYDDDGNIVNISITRNGTKNPVTVTVYGGGAGGIWGKMATELRTVFATELTDAMSSVQAGEMTKAELVKQLESWSKVFFGTDYDRNGKSPLTLLNDIKGKKSRDDVTNALRDFEFSEDFKKESLNTARKLYGEHVTNAIDNVFASNKRSSMLMNGGMNFITAMANDTFNRAYKALHTKRVEDGVIRDYDTLPAKDIGMLQRKIEEVFPYVKTAMSDETNIATRGEERAGDAGIKQVAYPGLDGKRKRVDVAHSTSSMGLPGVRSIPVLTISIDGAVQVNNHLLQGQHGNYLNVLDAIDRVADNSIRASNELFNVAEYMGLMQADTIGSVYNAMMGALKAQTKEMDIGEGLTITPTLASLENDPDARLNLAQEELRQTLKVIQSPINKEFGLAPVEIGDTYAMVEYLAAQLNVENQNNRKAREDFFLMRPQVAVNQMAGIDDGHANVVDGQVQLSDGAKKLISEDGLKRVEAFNKEMARRRLNRQQNPQDVLGNTELENLRQEIADADDKLERELLQAEASTLLGGLSGIWQDMRGSFDLNTDTFTFKLSSALNKKAFRKALVPTDVTFAGEAPSRFGTQYSYIPTLGDHVQSIVGTKIGGKDYLDHLLNETEVQVVNDLPEGTKGSYHTEKRGNKTVRVIKIRNGLTTNEANIVLAHELIHAQTQGGIAKGLADRAAKVNSPESQFVIDLWRQIGRFAKDQKDNKEYSSLIKLFDKAQKDPVARELVMNEFLAEVGSRKDASTSAFLSKSVDASVLSPSLRKLMDKAWTVFKKYIAKAWGKKGVEAATEVAGRNTEHDVLATIISGLGQNNLKKVTDPATGKDVLYSSVDNPQEELLPDQNILKAVEGQANNFLRTGFSITAQAVWAGIKVVAPDGSGVKKVASMSAAQRSEFYKETREDLLLGNYEETRLSGLRTTLGEFFARDSEASKRLDAFADIKQHSADAEREGTKQAVKDNLEDVVGKLDEQQNKAVIDSVIRGDLYALGNDTAKLSNILGSDEVRKQQIQATINQIKAMGGASERQKNFMINEALSLGSRQITGGAYRGLNLPNAKAIVRLTGSSLGTVTGNILSFEKAVDTLASLQAADTLTPEVRDTMVQLLRDKPEAMEYVANQQRSIVDKLVKQKGAGVHMSLPKGFLPDQVNPNRSIKVVPAADREKYKDYRFVRNFVRDPSDKNSEPLVMLASDHGGAVPYVQGALSTIESAIGGFTTTYGTATDKSLPSFTGKDANVRKIRASKSGRVVASRIEMPRMLENGVIPNVNSTGQITGFRYELTHADRENLLDTSQDMADTLSAYAARVGEQQVAEQFNKELVQQLKDAYDAVEEEDKFLRNDFVKVSADASEDLAEIWRVIPQHTKKEIKRVFGENALYVNKRDLDNALGYREWSVQQLWDGQLEVGSNKEFFIEMAETVLGDDARRKLRWAEQRMQGAVTAAKDLIVVKSIVVPVANVLSNAAHLMMQGLSIKDIYKDSREATEALHKYKKDVNMLRRLKERHAVSGDVDENILEDLANEVNGNPINFMVDAGLLPSVVEDITGVEDPDSLTGAIWEKITKKFPAANELSNNRIVDIGKELVISQDSKTYRFLADATEAGDFAAKYALYNHLVNKEGVSHDEAIDRIRVEFVNYNTLTNKQLDYMNKVGGIFFFKYFSRVQPIILNSIKRNPARALMTYIGADTIGLPSVFDAMWLGKDITATTGAYDLLNMAGGAHPIEGLL